MKLTLAALWFALALGSTAKAATCGGDFHAFVEAMSQEAVGAGVSQAIVAGAFKGMTPDQSVLTFDQRQQGVFSRTFEDYQRIAVTTRRVERGREQLRKHAPLLKRVEQEFGVPAPVVVAIWGLESNFGTVDLGNLPVIRTVTTLAHDCRRSELFQKEVVAALQILRRGDLPPREMIGGYAGEMGQTQFLPSSYIKYGVDYDRDGRVNLRRSVPDVLASTANFLKANGWQRDSPFEEGSANFEVMRNWNQALLYRKAIVLLSQRMGVDWGDRKPRLPAATISARPSRPSPQRP